MSRKTINDIKIPTYDDLFTTEEMRQDEKLEKIRDIPLSNITEFKNHPFRVRMDDDMINLVESISIHGGLEAISLALLVLFFVVGMVKTCTSLSEIKRPEQTVKLFLRFAIARGMVVYGMDIMLAIFDIVQGILSNIIATVGVGSASSTTLPQELIDAVNDCGFLESIPVWAVTLLGGIFITIMSFVLILTVYGRFFKIYMYTAISPIPLSASASEGTQSIAVSFIKSYIGVCMEGAIIILSCVIYSAYLGSAPYVDTTASAITMVWKYVGEVIFNMMVLVGTVKMSDHIVKDMMGL